MKYQSPTLNYLMCLVSIKDDLNSCPNITIKAHNLGLFLLGLLQTNPLDLKFKAMI